MRKNTLIVSIKVRFVCLDPSPYYRWKRERLLDGEMLSIFTYLRVNVQMHHLMLWWLRSLRKIFSWRKKSLNNLIFLYLESKGRRRLNRFSLWICVILFYFLSNGISWPHQVFWHQESRIQWILHEFSLLLERILFSPRYWVFCSDIQWNPFVLESFRALPNLIPIWCLPSRLLHTYPHSMRSFSGLFTRYSSSMY